MRTRNMTDKLQTFGAGNAPGGRDGALTKVFANAITRGIIIVNITQCEHIRPHARIPLTNQSGMTGSSTSERRFPIGNQDLSRNTGRGCKRDLMLLDLDHNSESWLEEAMLTLNCA